MKFSVTWLREFVDLPEKVEALADLLTLAGVEIEKIEERGADIPNVIIAQIEESTAHPNADRLSVCRVQDGSGVSRQIVCGAKNYQVGDKVPLALPGAELPGGFKIKASKLRGVESNGMLCSAKELGLAEDSAGLLILSPEARIGAPISELFPADTVLEVEITPNRGDLLSHYGLAREIAALTRGHLAKIAPLEAKAGNAATVLVSAAVEAPFYTLRRVEQLRVAPSPTWLRSKLESVGLRAINNVVDISNYVMLELGQPTHAFDAAKVDGSIRVRLARTGENLLALDGRNYELRPHHLVIADDRRPLGLAGVMGGEESGVSEQTTTILLESAYFLPASIRRTARELSLPSDASYRFERGVDPQMIMRASDRVVELLTEIAGGREGGPPALSGELPHDPSPVELRSNKLEQLLGTTVPPAEVDEILTRFGLEKNGAWKIPSYRRDLQREVDLIEEIIRAYGIDKVVSADRSRFTALSAADRVYDREMKWRRELVARGFSEARTSSLIPRGEPNRDAVVLRNPLSEDHVALRTSLVRGLVDSAGRNLRGGAMRIALFELGNVFLAATNGQKRHLALALTGKTMSGHHWRGGKRELDFFDLKGALTALGDFEFRRGERNGYSLLADVYYHDIRVGYAGQLAKTLVPDATGAVYAAEVDLDPLEKNLISRFAEMDRFPAITRDVAMFVPPEVSHGRILETIRAANEPLLERVELFDLFAEKGDSSMAVARKSLAYSLTYRNRDRTLTSDEVNVAHARVRERLRAEVGADLRE